MVNVTPILLVFHSYFLFKPLILFIEASNKVYWKTSYYRCKHIQIYNFCIISISCCLDINAFISTEYLIVDILFRTSRFICSYKMKKVDSNFNKLAKYKLEYNKWERDYSIEKTKLFA